MMDVSKGWTRVDDGEYNEQFTMVRGSKLTIYSDRDGEHWYAMLSGVEDDIDLDATGEFEARREALRIVG